MDDGRWSNSSAGAPASRWSRAPSGPGSGSPSSRRPDGVRIELLERTWRAPAGPVIYMVEWRCPMPRGAPRGVARRSSAPAPVHSGASTRASASKRCTPRTSPFVALHEVDSPEVFTGAAYRATGRTDQHRRVADEDGATGIATSSTASSTLPTFRMDRAAAGDRARRRRGVAGDAPGNGMRAVGPDRTVERRGLAVVYRQRRR